MSCERRGLQRDVVLRQLWSSVRCHLEGDVVLRQRVYLREIFSWERYGVAKDVVLRKTWSCERRGLARVVV